MTAMHAYGHEWACQLDYNPRIINGLGLSDGKGTERLWSRFIKLIGLQHSSLVGQYKSTVTLVSPDSQRQHHIWLLDCHAGAVAKDMVADLGDWLWLWLKKGIQEQSSAAQEVLDQCNLDTVELHKLWSDQRSAQLSIRACMLHMNLWQPHS